MPTKRGADIKIPNKYSLQIPERKVSDGDAESDAQSSQSSDPESDSDTGDNVSPDTTSEMQPLQTLLSTKRKLSVTQFSPFNSELQPRHNTTSSLGSNRFNRKQVPSLPITTYFRAEQTGTTVDEPHINVHTSLAHGRALSDATVKDNKAASDTASELSTVLDEVDEEQEIANKSSDVTELIQGASESIQNASEAIEKSVQNFTNSRVGTTRFQSITVPTNVSQIKALASVQTPLKADQEADLQQLVNPQPIAGVGAEEELALIVSKDEFLKMRVIGQFNKGFILTTLAKASSAIDEIFIIDQHASDEKFNFERLQTQTVLHSQPLVSPQALDLTAVEELTVADSLELLRKNGFHIEQREDGSGYLLHALPMSKNIVFDTSGRQGISHVNKDLMELIHQARDSPRRNMCCAKARRMFASRACRGSVMIGHSLHHKQMERIVSNLGQLHQPWVS